MLRCMYLELMLKVCRPAEDSSSPAKPARGSSQPARQRLTEEQRSAPLRGVQVATAKAYAASGQSLPPSRRVSTLFAAPERLPPCGEELPYPAHAGHRPKEEAALGAVEDELWLQRRSCLREGAEVHRQARQYVQQKVKPGMELREIVEMVEKATSALVGFDAKNPLQRGWAFPTGLSLNEVAAHDTVNPGDSAHWLQPSDIVKLDFGVHVEGHILDCAFSFTFDPIHDELMQAVKDATNEGIRLAGPDALVTEIGSSIQEIMEAGEVHRPDGKVLPVKAIKNLTGHSIAPYKIHAGKSLPSTNTGGRTRMLAGELWAIETFGSVGGLGYVAGQGNCSHFMRPSGAPVNRMQRSVLSDRALSLLEIIDNRFSTLAFCPRWLVQEAQRSKSSLLKGSGQSWWSSPLDELCNAGVVARYPPLADLRGSHTAQYEHTILLGARGKEVLTRGADY